MTELRYCIRCLYPSTKPRLTFDETGLCSACQAFDQRPEINWKAREAEFRVLVELAKAEKRPYDCIVPVSGGKDSHYQVLKALEYGLRPLAVTAMTDHLTAVGWRNLRNIANLGVDHVMVQTDQKLRRKIARYGLETVGDISWAEHITIFTVPIREAVLRGIPLILYGENPENEYGGPADAQARAVMGRNWLQEFGGLNGMRVTDLADAGIATREQLHQYTYPLSRIEPQGPQVMFLGHFFPWDSQENVLTAEEAGFDSWGVPSGAWLRGENLDNAQTGIHDRMMWLKFGYGRATAQLSMALRRGQISRETAVEYVRKHDGCFPSQYVDVSLGEVLEPLGLNIVDYLRIEHRFVNRVLLDVPVDFTPGTYLIALRFTVK
jgi:N-acetyl sugar amidotransferase